MVSEDFANSIATDKFCAGTKKGKWKKLMERIFTGFNLRLMYILSHRGGLGNTFFGKYSWFHENSAWFERRENMNYKLCYKRKTDGEESL